MSKKYYILKRGIHILLVILCIPISIIESMCMSLGVGLRDMQDNFFDRVREWVGMRE